MSFTGFVHLQCQSEYSVKNSLIRVSKLIESVKEAGMSSVALTDDMSLFSAVKFYQKATKEGIKPIIGSKLSVTFEFGTYEVLLLCQNHKGYLNLSELISKAYLGEQGISIATVNEEQLISHNEGLIMIAPLVTSDISKLFLSGKLEIAEEKVKSWESVFNSRYYMAVQRTNRTFDESLLNQTIELGLKLNIPVVATNDVQFLKKEDYEAHEARICISEGGLLDDARRLKHFSKAQYLKTPSEMSELFSDFPNILKNTLELSKRCNLHFELFEKNYLPVFPTPEGKSISEFFNEESLLGLKERLKDIKVNEEIYFDRLNFELSVILEMDYPGYFLIVSDFIRWAKENGIPVGPGRGSGAGSLVAWALSITNVDPIEHDLLFERFLNPERISMPDFDIDFCTDRRDEVIAYVASKYGSDKVSQIITYGTMAAKGVVRDVGRVLGHPYGFSDQISKMIPNELKITLEKALEDSSELKARYDSEESVSTLIDLSQELEGLIRNVGTHAGGVVIAPSKISDFCPIYKGADESDVIVSQFDKDDVEAVGLVKFDFLGLSNLTIIDKAVKIIAKNKLSEGLIDIDKLALDDPKVYKLLQDCDTTGVFQLESDGMRGYLKKLKADCFEDIVAMLALYRPGPLESGMVDDYIQVKHGAKVRYPHKILEEILKPTNGVFIYQEQVMKSAQIMAGYSLGGADILRRAMGKKKAEEMAEQREVFVKGAAKKNIEKDKANEIFDLIDKFSGYGFNKSHSVAYAYISYQTAWLKAHFPAPYMSAVLSSAMDDTDRVAFTVGESKKKGIIFIAPDINQSEYEFSIKDNMTIVYGLGAIKGVGEALVREIVIERIKNGDFLDIFDFCLRIEKKFLNRRALEALIYAGAFDNFGVKRATLISTYPNARTQAEQRQNDLLIGQGGLFAEVETDTEYEKKYISGSYLSFKQMMVFEKKVMGYYLNRHPTDWYKNELKSIVCTLPNELVFRNNREVRVLALISDIDYRNTRRGLMASLKVEDGKRKINAAVFSQALSSNSDQLILDEVVVISGKVNQDFREQWQIVVDKIEPVQKVQLKYAKFLKIKLSDDNKNKYEELCNLLKDFRGKCPVIIEYQSSNASGNIPLSKEYDVSLDRELLDTIEQKFGHDKYQINY
ncbi:DNA polymerase III subunit alpha [Candidatus Thioglobus sp. NP1]|uniref:DNA polymerase III subunit alpha n=1 Tax=Candidatus Thioglobus sp. NP1 TaxID=2508687 RepID=UPI000DEE0CD7|nr:DNA polymerase III subunit alpha [Candidatus Thioglobus sp. NP1]AXE62555.1 DNA polymerase III subunit alpha [Candidatus Thioglobus sp. NP1]